MFSFRILHISDLHLRGPREHEPWRRRRVIESFWQNLDELQSEGKIDLVCFTGDLADWGRPEEYEEAGLLLTELLSRLQLSKDRLFLIPGNHDVARTVELATWNRARVALRQPDASTVFSRWLAGGPAPYGLTEDVLDAILARQSAYQSFVTDFGLEQQQPKRSPHGRLGYRSTIRLADRPFDVHVIGFDSAWLSGDDNDSGKLLLTEDQVMRLSSDAQGQPLPGIRIGLLHHPLSDLADGAQCRRHLAERIDFLLRGHLHSPEPELWADPDRRLLQLATGCLYEGHAGDTYPNACQTIAVHVDPNGRPVYVDLRFRAFSPKGGHWHDDPSLYRTARDGRLRLGLDGRVIDRTEPAYFFVPLIENQYFIGRERILAEISGRLTTNGTAVLTQPQALSGLGGVGKTQLALAFAYRERHRYRAVLWVRADSEDSLRSGFADLALRLELPVATESRSLEDSVAQVRHWLETTDRVLLVCDGADSPELLRRLLPRKGHCHVLITSRAHDFQLLGIVDAVEVVELPHLEAVEFLLRRTGRVNTGPEERAAAHALAQELGGLPLALEQAAAFVVTKAVSFADYLTSYKHRSLRLLNRSPPLMGDYPATVATTWHMNFEEVKRSSAAVTLLRFSAFLAADAIPIALFTEGAAWLDPKLAQAIKDVKSDPVLIGELLEPLLRYSLVRRDRDANTISIHKMVQAVVRDSIHEDSRREYARRLVQALSATFPDPAVHTTWATCDRFLGHALAATQLCAEHRFEGEVAAHLHNQVALYLDHRMQVPEAERLFRQAIALRRKIDAAPDSPLQNRVCLAVNLCNLASLLMESGRLTAAEEPIREAEQLLETKEGSSCPFLAFPLRARSHWLRQSGRILEQERVLQRAWKLAQSHPETVLKLGGSLLTLLAVNALERGNHSVAEQRFEQALQVCKTLHGVDSPEYAQVQIHRGHLQRDQGKYQDAEQAGRAGLETVERLFGREHHQFANAACFLAKALIERGSYLEAKGLLEEARHCWTSLGRPDHEQLPNTLLSLAACHRHLAQYSLAVSTAEEALRLEEAQCGSNVPALWCYLSELGLAYLEQERYSDADQAFRRALKLLSEGSGDDSLDLATLYNNLALVHEAAGRYQEAQKEYERSLGIVEKGLGAEHPETCLTLHNLAQSLTRVGRYREAKTLFERALIGWRKTYGSSHQNVAVCLYGLAFVNRALGDVGAAVPQLLESCAISEKVLAPDHPYLAQSLAALGQHYRASGRLGEAQDYYERALAILHRSEADSMVTATIEGSLGMVLFDQNKTSEAESILRRALKKKEAKLGVDHPQLGPLQTDLALCLNGSEPNDEVEGLLLRAIKGQESSSDQDGPILATALANLAALRKQQGRIEEATTLAARAVEIRAQTLGDTHPDVALSHGFLGELALLRGHPEAARHHLARGALLGGPGNQNSVHALRIGHLQFELGDLRAASTTLQGALSQAAAEFGTTSEERLVVILRLVAAQLEQGDLSGSEQSIDEAGRLLDRLPQVQQTLRWSFSQAKATLLRHRGQLTDARELLSQALTEIEGQSATPESVQLLITIRNNLGGILELQGSPEVATALYEACLQRLPEVREEQTRQQLEMLTLSNLAANLFRVEQRDKGVVLFKKAEELRRRLRGEGHPRDVTSWQQEAAVARANKDWLRSRTILEKALATAQENWSKDHPGWAILWRDLGEVLTEIGDVPVAAQYLEQALHHDERILGDTAPQLRRDLLALMRLAKARQDTDAAVEYAQRRVQISRGQSPVNYQHVIEDEALLGVRLREAGDLAGAQAATERSVSVWRENPSAKSATVYVQSLLNLGCLHRDQENMQEARRTFESVIQYFHIQPPHTDDERHRLAIAHQLLGDCLMFEGVLDSAGTSYETSLQIRRSASVREIAEEAATLNNLAQVRLLADDLEAAEALLRQAVELARQAQDQWGLINVGRNHAQVLALLGRTEDARQLLAELIPMAQQLFGEQHDETLELSNRFTALGDVGGAPRSA